MKFSSDVDIDFADRQKILSILKHIPASQINEESITKHNTGVYFHEIPINPMTNSASLDYKIAEQRGYIKLDFLNVSVYQLVKNENHLTLLMRKPPNWGRLQNKEFCQQLVHIGNHYKTLISMPEPINSIEKLAMFLAIIRPAKRHLIGKSWDEISKTVWDKDQNDLYQFKKSHSISYAHLIVVHMNLIEENELNLPN